MTQKLSAKIMRIASYVLILYSIIWGLAPYTAINLPARILLDILDWPFDNATEVLDKATIWLSSIGAGLLLALSIFYLKVIAPALENGNKELVKVGIWAIIAWYVVDGAGSFASGVPSNVVFNTIYLIFVLFPLLAVKYKTA